ncbi:hypothetical protein ACA910_005944 [Epithemia clementina (nom. ined.)]
MKPQTSTTSLSVVPSPSSGDVIPPLAVATEGTTAHAQHSPQADASDPQQQQVDFVGSSAAVKDLFSLPYTAEDCSLSVAIHNVEGTLIFDRDPQLDNRGNSEQPTKLLFSKQRKKGQTRPLPERRTEPNESSEEGEEACGVSQALVALSSLDQLSAIKMTSGAGYPKSEALSNVNSVVEVIDTLKQRHDLHAATQDGHGGQSDSGSCRNDMLGLPRPDDYVHQHIPPTPEPREYLTWKFHDMNFWVGSDALILRGKEDGSSDSSKKNEVALTVRVEDAREMQELVKKHDWAVKTGVFLPDHQRSMMQQRGKPSYAAAAVKNTSGKTYTTLPPVEAKKNSDPVAIERVHDTARVGEKNGGFSAPDLDEVKLQTCIVPTSTIPAFGLLDRDSPKHSQVPFPEQPQPQHSVDTRPAVVSPVSTVLDAYLDNIMANVPQLALCLREKGFIQSVKLLETEHIPSAFLLPSTMDTSKPFGVASDEADKVFSPQVMEMNAAALLKFLKLNCTRDNATYLLRREYGQTNIHLYDISSISALKQRKWIWWLAMMSCRFAHRLRNISMHTQEISKKRSFRQRERALLQNALELLEVLTDMDGSTHESLAAGVRENLADTFLRGEDDLGTSIVPKEQGPAWQDQTPASPEPATSVSSSQHPYASLNVDALNKAHDHLSQAIKCLFPYLESRTTPLAAKEKEASPSPRVSSIDGTSSDESDEEFDGSRGKNDLEVIASATQLFGLHEKIINVLLRQAEIHLRNYYSSSAMQTLRAAARRIADSLGILTVLSCLDINHDRDREWLRHVQMQYVWLWEHCGHFARSFAGDGLWRDRGHAGADDILIVLQDAESAFTAHRLFDIQGSNIDLKLFTEPNPLSAKTHDSVNFHSLSGIVQTERAHEATQRLPSTGEAGLDEAREAMQRQKFLLREERKVIVAACLAYERAVNAFKQIAKSETKLLDKTFLILLQQRLGDACNEAGKILLDQLRTELSQRKEESPSDGAAHALLASAEFWFMEALKAFEESKDLRNLVLLRCNLCQCYKLRANALFSTGSSSADQSAHAEGCLQDAANQLECAHEALGERATDSMLWDMVSAELAATFLVLGVRRRQSLIGSGSSPMISQSLRLSPGQERKIVDPMNRALKIYESNGNLHQAAAAHYQLALFFSKVWTCQRDEAKTREKLAAAFTHYSAAHAFFSQAVRGNELTFCLVCLDLSNLYSSVQGEEGNVKALFCCLDTMSALAKLANEETPENSQRVDDWYRQMETVASSVEDRVFKLLRSLVKLNDDGQTNIPYKDIYRASLRAKTMIQKPVSTGQQLVLDSLSNVYKILKATDEATIALGLK